MGTINMEYMFAYSISNKLRFKLFFLDFLTTLSNGDALMDVIHISSVLDNMSMHFNNIFYVTLEFFFVKQTSL